MDPANPPRLGRPLSFGPSVEVWSVRLGSRRAVVRRYPPPRPGTPWPPPPDPTVLAVINHPALVRYLGHWRDDEDAELHAFAELQGETLAEALRRGPLLAGRWTEVMAACARGLRWLHERCPVAPRLHGDVSPSNIHLSTDGSVRWLDVRADRPSIGPAGPGVLVGTLPYLAPEVLAGGRATQASEVYALGLVALRAAIGPLPWGTVSSPREVLEAFHRTPPASLARALPAPAASLLSGMLLQSPDDRPTAGDVVSCLR